MKYSLHLTLCLIFFSFIDGYSQCPTGELLMLTQSHIDKFAELYPNCTELDFDITINGDGGSDITNVSAFALIEKAEDIKIENCHLLKNLNGLNKLKEVDWLTISSNETLESIKALGGLQKATLISINHNPILDWSNNFTNVTSLSTLYVSTSLKDLEYNDFNNLKSINTINIKGEIIVKGFQNIKSIHSIRIDSNTMYRDVNNVIAVFGNKIKDLVIKNVHYFSDDGLENFNSLTGLQYYNIDTLRIEKLPYNSTLIGLKIKECGGIDKVFIENAPLRRLGLIGLEDLVSVGPLKASPYIYLNFQKNPILETLAGLAEQEEIYSTYFVGNPKLSMCSIKPICELYKKGFSHTLRNNALGCNSVEEVLEGCEATSTYNISKDLKSSFTISPNPVFSELKVELNSSLRIDEIEIQVINSIGQVARKVRPHGHTFRVDMSEFSQGAYFLHVIDHEGLRRASEVFMVAR